MTNTSLPLMSVENANRLAYFSMALFCATLPWSLALMQITLVLTMLACIYFLYVTRQKTVYHPILLYISIYLLFRILSIVLSPDPARSIYATFQQDWTLIAIPLLASIQFSQKQWKNIFRILAVSVLLVTLYGLIQSVVGTEYIRSKALDPVGDHQQATFFRATGAYNMSLTFAGNQLMFLGFFLGYTLLYYRNTNDRKFQLFLLTLLLPCILMTFARSAWLGMVLLIGVGTFIISRKLFFYSLAALLIIGIVSSSAFPDIRGRITSILDVSKNEARINLWHTSLMMIADNPVGGIGTGLFNRVFELYKVPGHYVYLGHSHNDYLNLAANSGIPALIAWLAMWVSWIRSSLSGLRNKELPPLQQSVILGCFLAIIGILFSSIFQCYFTDLENNIAWILFTGLGLNALINRWEPGP